MKKLVRTIYASSEQPTFNIPVKWQMQTVMNVTADSLKEAVKYVNKHEYDLPSGEYVDDTFEIDYDRLEKG